MGFTEWYGRIFGRPSGAGSSRFRRIEVEGAFEPGRVSEKVCPECKSHEGEPHEPWCSISSKRCGDCGRPTMPEGHVLPCGDPCTRPAPDCYTYHVCANGGSFERDGAVVHACLKPQGGP